MKVITLLVVLLTATRNEGKKIVSEVSMTLFTRITGAIAVLPFLELKLILAQLNILVQSVFSLFVKARGRCSVMNVINGRTPAVRLSPWSGINIFNS